MGAARWINQRGFTFAEVLIGAAIGTIVILALSFMYVATVRALDESSSQAALQRTGSLVMRAIMRQVALAQSNPSSAPYANCVPAGTTGQSLVLSVAETNPLSINPNGLPPPHYQTGTYCFYAAAGNNGDGATPGALCQRVIPDQPQGPGAGVGGPGTASTCWNLLAGGQPGATHVKGQTGTISLVQQTNPANAFCPLTAGGTAIAAGNYCLALNLNPGSQQTSDIAFAITDGLNSMTFTSSSLVHNHP